MIDKQRRNFLKTTLLLFSLPIEKTPQQKNFISQIIGKEIDENDIRKIKQVLGKIRANFTNLKIENIIDYLQFFHMLGFLPFKKIKKSVVIGEKILVVFPYYSQNWKEINYTGRAIDNLDKSLRYPDPQIEVLIPKEDELSFDVCVIGSGAGGSFSALKLSEKYSTCIVERGKLVKPSEFTEREEDMIPKLYRISADRNLNVITLYGNCVGGSTVHNTALFVKLPEKIYEYWESKGFSIKKDEFYNLQDEVFKIAQAEKINSMNKNNAKIKEGIEKLGIKYFIPHHSRKDCLQVGFCELGCYWNRKFSTLIRIIPKIQEKGGKIIPETKALYFEKSGKKIKYLVCDYRGKKFKIKARYFVLSAGAMSSPIILRRSEINTPHGLCLHPSTYVMGIFEEDIFSWQGIPISLLSDEFLKEDSGFVIMPYAVHPATFSIAIGGVGEEHYKNMLKYKNISMLAVMLHDRPSGRILNDRGIINFSYEFDRQKTEDFKKGISICSEILFEAGAKEVILPSITKIQKAKSKKDVKKYTDDFDISQIPILSVHPQATLRWSKVLDEDGSVKGTENLFVADTSVFPESCGVPPQVTAMTVGLFAAKSILAR